MLSKKAELPSLQVTPYSTSIDQSLLKKLIFMRASEDMKSDATLETVMDEDIENLIRSFTSNESDEVDPALLREAMRGCKFPVQIIGSSTRITTYCADVFNRLEAAGFGDFKSDNPRFTVKMMIENISPPALKIATEDRIQVEPRLKDNIRLFIQRLKADARA